MKQVIAGLFVVALLVSCGGGGSSAPTPAAPAVPGAPQSLAATAADASASFAFTPPSSNGGAAITGYTVTCTAAGATRSAGGAVSPIVVSGLANATTYSCSATATNSAGTGAASNAVSVTPVAASSAFALSSPAVASDGLLPAAYTCDGPGSSPALAWVNPPPGTQQFALLLTTVDAAGTTKWNWVLHDLPGTLRSLARDALGPGTAGVGSDGPFVGYQPPCSQGPGAKSYTFTLYALSGAPSLGGAATPVAGATLAAAVAPITLGSATLTVSYTRAASPTGSSAGCLLVRDSLAGSATGGASVGCDATYAFVSSTSLAAQTMMNGITATNLQVPVAQNFLGANGWRIPLNPAIAATTVSAVDGPIGVAVNGVLIFNPCKQGGCQNGDTKVLGELDQCNGHAGRADDYHYHAAPVCLMATRPAGYWDTHPVGWALDGFAIFGYNDADGTIAVRDGTCGGNTRAVVNAPAGYAYHVTDASPYVLSCFRGTPSPDLAGQGGKFSPMRQPPVTPLHVSAMTLATDATDGYQVLQFSTAVAFSTTETGSDSYANPPGTYRIRYKPLSGTALAAALAGGNNAGRSQCWNFQFTDGSGATTQPAVTYCR